MADYATESRTRSRRHHSTQRRSLSRSRSPRERREERRHRHRNSRDTRIQPELPFNSRALHRHDLPTYRSLFASYLDIQKQIDIEALDEAEVRGRWKSFVNKWNRGDLAEGWYDPTTLSKAQARERSGRWTPPKRDIRSAAIESNGTELQDSADTDNSDDEDDYGPIVPAKSNIRRVIQSSHGAGPSIPNMADLREKRELEEEDVRQAREESLAALRAQRKADRRLQNEQLNEIAPRAEAGTKERQLEKKREVASANKTFAEARERSPEFRDADLMGDEGDGLADLKRRKKDEERKKSERELRREEALRARAAEREERLKGIRAKEEKTVAMLKELAKARFGSGGPS